MGREIASLVRTKMRNELYVESFLPVIPVHHKLGAAQCGDSDLKDLRFKGIVWVF